MSEISETEIKSMTKEQNYMRGYEDGKSDVLDKIRAEIAEYKDDKIIHYERNEMIDIVLGIIDKYKVESEDKE